MASILRGIEVQKNVFESDGRAFAMGAALGQILFWLALKRPVLPGKMCQAGWIFSAIGRMSAHPVLVFKHGRLARQWGSHRAVALAF